MRVIAGTHRGRLLRGPKSPGVRPTSDRVKEALFSIIGQRVINTRFLDLYAGTGAVSIEALSRGATYVASVESDANALRLLRRNVQDCAMSHLIRVHDQTVARFLAHPARWEGPYQIVFADPPYERSADLVALLSDPVTDQLFADDAWLLVEHAAKTTLPAPLGPGCLLRRYHYGDTALSLYSRRGPAQP